MPNRGQGLSEQEILADLLAGQTMLTAGYNSGACECVNPALKADLMNILNEEHQIQQELLSEMVKRGWYQPEQAEAEKIIQAKQKYSRQM